MYQCLRCESIKCCINQSLGTHTKGRRLAHLPTPALVITPVQVPVPYQVTPNRKHGLAPAMNFVSAPLASSTLGYPFQKQPEKQDHLLGNVPQCHMPIYPELTLADYGGNRP